MTVGTIQTHRAKFITCCASHDVRDFLRSAPAAYDFFPVKPSAETERIIGLLPAHSLRGREGIGGTIREHLHYLDESWVIGADASIKDFVVSADRQPCRMVVSGAEITGLVSLSDIQRLPVRAALFALITGFEMAMADRIRQDLPSPDLWRSKLSSGRRAKLDEKLAVAKSRDDIDDDLLFTEFCDKAEICTASFAKAGRKNRWRDVLKRVRNLRDDIAHAYDYAPDRGKARDVSQTVRDLLDLLEELTGADR